MIDMEMMAQYYSFNLSPEQIRFVGMVWLIVMAAVVVFDLKTWLRPPAPRHNGEPPISR
jgi:hypothetical protein